MDKSILTKLLKICIIFLIAFLGIVIIRYTYSILIPILAVFLIASFMEPAVLFLTKRMNFPRPLSSFLILLFIILIIIWLILLILTEVYDGIAYLAAILPEQLHQLGLLFDELFHLTILPFYEQVFQLFHEITSGELVFIQDYIADLFQEIAGLIGTFFQNLLVAISSNLSVIPESITIIFFVLFASFLLSSDFPRVKVFCKRQIPNNISEKLGHVLTHLKKSIFGYVKAQLILILITFHLIFLGLVIIGIEHALTISLFMMMVDLIPFVGTGLFFMPWIGYSFLSGNYALTIGLSIVYGVVIIARQLLEPKIYSMNLAIHPLAWLVAAFIGMKMIGFIGLILAPFTLILLKGLHEAGIFRWIIDYIQENP